MPKFNKMLKTPQGEISFRAEYNNNYLTIVIDKWQYMAGVTDDVMETPIFEGKISLKTEIDEYGEIKLPDWIEVIGGLSE